jgi:microcystin-dependent protein
MPRNSSGIYSLPQSPFVPGTVISSAAVNSDFADIATALTGSIASNGTTAITNPIKFPPGSAVAPTVTFSNDTTTGLYSGGTGVLGLTAGGGVGGVLVDSTQVGVGQSGNQLYYRNGAVPCPVGTIVDFAGSTHPTGWYLCAGQSFPIASYPELYATIGTTYGGDGITTFNLPDLRGRLTAGLDNLGGTPAGRITGAGSGVPGQTLGGSGGEQNVTLAQTNMPVTGPTFTGNGITVNSDQNDVATWGGNSTTAQPGASAAYPEASNMGHGYISVTFTPSGTVAGGSATPVITMPPVMMLLKIIFAGR